jgi:C-terminal processing protease CtpA/Prc
MLVEAPASRPITFVAEEVKVLRVVVRDREGALGKAGLATGDRIVAIDGREFSGRQQLDFIRQTLQGKEVTLTVQRGDQRFEVVVSRRLLVGGPTADGTLYEAAR